MIRKPISNKQILGNLILGRQGGYILLPVVLLISLVAVAAFTLNNKTVLETSVSVSALDTARAGYVANAGLQHAMWQVEQAGCGPFTDINAEGFGDHSYSATVTPNNIGGSISIIKVGVTDDAWIKSDAPITNYGSDAQLRTYFTLSSYTIQRTLYRFDIAAAGLSPDAQIISATARIFVLDENAGADVTVHQINADWNEATVNWDNINSNYDSTSIATIPKGSVAGQYVDVNITAIVQSWINGSVSNQGIVLRTSTINDLAQYTSKEYATASQRPELVIKIASGSLSNRVDVSVTGTLASGISKNLSRKDFPLYQAPSLSLTLQPSSEGKDAEIWDQQPNNNYGNAAETWVSSASNDKTRSLLQFNVNAIPVGAKIQSATLSLLRQSGSGADQPVSAHRILNPWSENTVSWNSRQTGTNWDTTGSDFDSMAITTTPVGPANQRYEWNITPLVQGWVDGSFQNYGVVLAAAIAGMPGERFYTSDDSDPTRHPSLTITYTCECGIVCLPPQGSGNILFVVVDEWNMSIVEQEKKALFESWGYTVTLISQWDVDWNFNNLAASNDVAYVSETVDPTTFGLAPKLAATTIGVINEEGGINVDLGTSSDFGSSVGNSLDVIDTSHYITALFPTGILPIHTANMENLLASGTMATNLQILGNDRYGAPALAVVATGGLLADGNSIAAGNRVMLPIGSSGHFNWDYLNNNGRLIVQRAIQWGIDAGSSPPPPKKIYWTDDTAELIQRSDEDGSNVETVVSGQAKVRGLDIDTVNGKMYWTSDTEIRRSDLDGSNIETIYSGSLVNLDIKLDVAGGKMYWSHDNGNDQVMRANLNGSNSETINSSLASPAYITLDTVAGKLYTTEFATGDVSRMNLDGNVATTLITGVVGAVGNALDTAGGKVYWSGGSSSDWIKRANLDGSNEQTIITGLNAPQDIAYDADNDRIYWVDALVTPSIKRASADGSNVETIVTVGLNRPRGIVIVDANLVSPPVGGGSGSGGSGSCDGTYRDDFSDQLYNLSTGTLTWSSDWEETGESTNPTGGDIRIENDTSNYQLMVRDDGQTVMREADLSNAASATLSFDYRRENLNGSGDYVAVEVSYDGGSNWNELDRFTGTADDSSYSSTSYTLNASSLSANTRIRFLTPSNGMSNSNRVYFDNVQIECSP